MLSWIAALSATPSPVVTPADEIVTPGPLGFAAIAFIGVAVFFLVWDMLRRIRRGRYREEVAAELDAEEQAITARREAGEPHDGVDPRDQR